MRRFSNVLLWLVCVLAPAAAIGVELTPAELELSVREKLGSVDEFKAVAHLARKRSLRAFLFGGTAATFVHYVRRDRLRSIGEPSYQWAPYSYDLSEMFRSEQDLDIAVTRADGSRETPQDITSFRDLIRQRIPSHRNNPASWEILGLYTGHDRKAAILENADFQNQNTDSQSTGLVELTWDISSAHSAVTDARDRSGNTFLVDAASGLMHFYRSANHRSTLRAGMGDNPEILSALRALRKALQFSMGFDHESWDALTLIEKEFTPRRQDYNAYAQFKIDVETRKLVSGAEDLSTAMIWLERLNLKQKLIDFSHSSATTEGSVAWLLQREPLNKYSVLPSANGRTAGAIGLTRVTHATSTLDNYLSITASPNGKPNAFQSRPDTPGEQARFGNGYYTRSGERGMSDDRNAIHIGHCVDPSAEEGRDFSRYPNDIVLWHNGDKLRTDRPKPKRAKPQGPSCASEILNFFACAVVPIAMFGALAVAAIYYSDHLHREKSPPVPSVSFSSESSEVRSFLSQAAAVGDSPEEALAVLQQRVEVSVYLELRSAAIPHRDALEAGKSGFIRTYQAIRRQLPMASHAEALEAATSGFGPQYLSLRVEGALTHSEALHRMVRKR